MVFVLKTRENQVEEVLIAQEDVIGALRNKRVWSLFWKSFPPSVAEASYER